MDFSHIIITRFSSVNTVFRDLPLIQVFLFKNFVSYRAAFAFLISSSNLLCDFCVQSSFPWGLLFSLIQERLSKGFYLSEAFGSPLLVNTQAYLAVFYL